MASKGDGSLFSNEQLKAKNIKGDLDSRLSDSAGQVQPSSTSQAPSQNGYEQINEFLKTDNSLETRVQSEHKTLNKNSQMNSTPSSLIAGNLEVTSGVVKTVQGDKNLTETNNVINYINNIKPDNSSIKNNNDNNSSAVISQTNSINSKLAQNNSGKVSTNTTVVVGNIDAQTAQNVLIVGNKEKSKAKVNLKDNQNKQFSVDSTSFNKEVAIKHNNQQGGRKHSKNASIINNAVKGNPNNNSAKKVFNLNNQIESKNEQANQKRVTNVNANDQDVRKQLNEHDKMKTNNSKVDLETNYTANSNVLQNNIENKSREPPSVEIDKSNNISRSGSSKYQKHQNDRANVSLAESETKQDPQQAAQDRIQQEVPNNIINKGPKSSVTESNKQNNIAQNQFRKTTLGLEFIADIKDLLPNSTPTTETPTRKNVIVTSFFVNPSSLPKTVPETNKITPGVTSKLTLEGVARKIFNTKDILNDQQDPLQDVQAVDLLALPLGNSDETGETTQDKLYDEPEPILKDLNAEGVENHIASALGSVIGLKHDPEKATWTQTKGNLKLLSPEDAAVAKHDLTDLKSQSATTLSRVKPADSVDNKLNN